METKFKITEPKNIIRRYQFQKQNEFDGWISIETDLPKVGQYVLLYFNKSCVTIGRLESIEKSRIPNQFEFEQKWKKILLWDIGRQKGNDEPKFSNIAYVDVTHWMPFVELPSNQ